MRAVCLVSGGMDSCVSAAFARQQGHDLAFLHVSYGQRTEERERQAFEELADFFRVRNRLVISLSHLNQIGGSALTDSTIQVPAGLLDRQGIPVTYVPFRNANLLSAAVSWAEVQGARYIYIGAVEEDSSGYPDCRGTFFEAFNAVIREGSRPESEIEIVTPLLHLTKKSIVEEGSRLGVPFHLTWSCYRAVQEPCGDCDSCLLRARGFEQAGVSDPLLG